MLTCGPLPLLLDGQYALPSDPHYWSTDGPEADDYLHNPDSKRDRKNDKGGTIFTWRGLTNLGCLAVLVLALTMLFMGYPLYTEFSKRSATTLGGFNLGGIKSVERSPLLESSCHRLTSSFIATAGVARSPK